MDIRVRLKPKQSIKVKTDNVYVWDPSVAQGYVDSAEGYATSASNSADLAKQWAIGDPSEPVGYSSKYWANEASSTVSNMANKDLSNLSATGEAKFTAVETSAKNYADSLSVNYATAAQGALADTAVQPADLATVATTGSYNDLLNKPTIPAAQVNSDWNALSGVAQILNKPTIPTVNNSTITITQGGVTKGSFTLNQASGDTIALDAGASVDWGDIGGTLADQTDLNTALGNKANTDADNFTATGKSTIAELPMPSDSYVDLTPVASGSLLVTAPANGYVYLEGTSVASIAYCSLDVNNIYTQISWCTAGVTNGLSAFVPVRKGANVYMGAYNFAATYCKFIYAEGEI